jgi:hypothetical protein
MPQHHGLPLDLLRGCTGKRRAAPRGARLEGEHRELFLMGCLATFVLYVSAIPS